MVMRVTPFRAYRHAVSAPLSAALAVIAMLVFSVGVAAQTEREENLEKQMAEAQAQLDEAAQRVAELSRRMAGGEVASVVKRISVGQRKAMLGVRIDDARDGEGVRILDVTPEGPAERAGVRKGDLVEGINGEALTGMDSGKAIKRLLESLRTLEPEEVASLDLRRDGQALTIDVTTESVADSLPRFGAFHGDNGVFDLDGFLEGLSEDLGEAHAQIMIDGDWSDLNFDASEMEELKQLPQRIEEALSQVSVGAPMIAMLGGHAGLSHEFRFAPVTPGLGNYFGVERGVLVTAVPEDDTLGIQEGDVLLSVNGKAVDSKHDVYAVFAKAEKGDTLAVELVRQRQSLTVDVVAPSNGWGHSWTCTSDGEGDREQERCVSKDGSAFSFRFSHDDD